MKSITSNGLFIDLNKSYLINENDVLNSDLFRQLLIKFISYLKKKKMAYFKLISSSFENDDQLIDSLIDFFKIALVFDLDSCNFKLKQYKSELLTLVERFYNFYRKYERYVYVEKDQDENRSLKTRELIEKDQYYNNLILKLYRKISENLMGESNQVYRQLNAGSNAGFLLEKNPLTIYQDYSILNKVKLIDSIILHPPFIIYPKNTKRSGIFGSCLENPINYIDEKDLDNYLLYPIYIGKHTAYVYFNIEFAYLGVSLANLFAPIRREDLNGKPDLILLYGVDNEKVDKAYYFKDEKNDVYVGVTPNNEEMSYFGYLKKILLTIHNLKCIDNNEIPLHGAMVSIKLTDGTKSNICMIGDSGAGKSETLETLKEIMDDDISEMVTVFDDMGYVNENLEFFGTETGAFVRMDDLDNGYAYKEIDRAIFMNPDKINSRLIIPVTTLEEINKPHNVDIFLYANNYEEESGIKFFKSSNEALPIFKAGQRRAKGTTSETGLVSSYFANPFGPVQRKEKMESLLDKFFTKLFQQNIYVGEVHTKLGTKNFKKDDLVIAAKCLLAAIKKN